MNEAEIVTLSVPVSERDHTIGARDAAVTVVNYGDYECPGCAKRHRQVEKVAEELLGKVRLVHRHYPLVHIHPHALRAAEAAEAAAAQGKFWEMHRLLYRNPDKLTDPDLRGYAQKIGLDIHRYDREMASGTYAGSIMQGYYDSLINGITGTPTTFINGVFYPMSGPELIEVVKRILDDQTAR